MSVLYLRNPKTGKFEPIPSLLGPKGSNGYAVYALNDSLEIDFKDFAAKASLQPWWSDLDDSTNPRAAGVKILGVIKHGVDATDVEIVEPMDAWIRENFDWHITDMMHRTIGYSNAYSGHALAIDPEGKYYGMSFYPFGATLSDPVNGPIKRRFNITVFVTVAGRYRLVVDSFFESGSKTEIQALEAGTPRLVPNPWNYRTGAFVDVYKGTKNLVNDGDNVDRELVASRVPFSYKDNVSTQKDVLVDLGVVDLKAGENILTFDPVEGYWGQCNINFSRVLLTPAEPLAYGDVVTLSSERLLTVEERPLAVGDIVIGSSSRVFMVVSVSEEDNTFEGRYFSNVPTQDSVNKQLGDVSEALNSILDIQNKLIGGAV